MAFLARFDDGRDGIFVGTDPVTGAALLEGDSLFGGTLQQVTFGGNGLNDSGQFAFSYQLTNGRSGVGLATRGAVTVPESSAFALALPALGMVGVVLIKRRKK